MLFAMMVATFALHEAGHWLAAIVLGHDAFYGLNSAGTREQISASHRMILEAAGPAVTVLQGLIAFTLTRGGANLTAFAVLWSAALSRPSRSDPAPVNAPLTWPNSSDSNRLSDVAPRSIATIGLAARRDWR